MEGNGGRGLVDGRCSGVWGVITVRWLGQSPYGLALGERSLLLDHCMVCIPPKRIPKSSHCPAFASVVSKLFCQLGILGN